ncbi:hypothetical protein Tco_0867305, partial [Tanacetum coccineum]
FLEKKTGIEYPCFNAESDLLESLLQQDTSINDSQKIDSLLDEFAGELTLLHSIPPGIDDVNLDPEGDIFDSLMEEIDIFLDGNGSIPPGIESDDYDSEDDDNSTSRPEFESFHVDYPDSGDSTIDVVEDIPVDVPNILAPPTPPHMDFDFIPSHNDLGSDLDNSSPSGDRNKIYDPGICIEVESTRFLAPLSPVIDTLLPFSSENEDKVFNHGVLAYKEKSPPSSSHRGLKALQLSPKSLILIHGDNTPNLGTGYSLKDKNKAKPGKTESGIGKSAKNQSQRYKRVKTELKRTFSDRLGNVCAFNEVKMKSKSTPGYGFGKSMEKRT